MRESRLKTRKSSSNLKIWFQPTVPSGSTANSTTKYCIPFLHHSLIHSSHVDHQWYQDGMNTAIDVTLCPFVCYD